MPARHALAAVMLAICATAAEAQSYPVKPIKLIVPYTPGSPVDVLARVVTQQVAARLGQGVDIDNRPGAGTTLGTKMAASTEPDALYDADEGFEAHEFKRTASRLIEMRSQAYLALPHGHAAASGSTEGLIET